MLVRFSEMQAHLVQMQSCFLQEFDCILAVEHSDLQHGCAESAPPKCEESEKQTWVMLDRHVSSKRTQAQQGDLETCETRFVSDEIGDHVAAPVSSKSSAGVVGEATTSKASSSIEKNDIIQTTTSSTMEASPQRAFVVNIRRLVEVEETLALLHDFVKSTAIAALTLVAAATPFQFCTTIFFLATVFAMYIMNEADWDSMDIADLQMLLPLLCNDCDAQFETTNPNRLFKACSVEKSRLRIWRSRLIQLGLFITVAVGWIDIAAVWKLDFTENWTDLPFVVVDPELRTETDVDTMGFQLTVGSLMFFMVSLFRYIIWREMYAVMPRHASGEIWDPRKHGTPLSYWIGGLPSMWFTSQEVAQKLQDFIGQTHPGGKIEFIFPQELAYYALAGDGERLELKKTLGEAKLFGASSQTYVLGPYELPQPLAIDLCFFDSQRQGTSYPHLGDFQYFFSDEEGAKLPSESNHMETFATHGVI